MSLTRNTKTRLKDGSRKPFVWYNKYPPPTDNPFIKNPDHWRDYSYYLKYRKGKETKKVDAKAWRHIPRIVRLCKGEYTDSKAYSFFNYFTTVETSPKPETWQKVQELLQSAFWVEEEDIEQECKMFILSKRTGGGYTLRHLTCHIARYLIFKQGVFKRQDLAWNEAYKYMYHETTNDLDYTENNNYRLLKGQIYPELTHYENYLAYLVSLGYTKTRLKQLDVNVNKLFQLLRSLHD